MDAYIDFTVDNQPGRPYENLTEAVTTWHAQNIKFVPILDAGISIANDTMNNNYFEQGQTMNVFMLSAQNPTLYNGTLIGKVWPGLCGFVDYLSANASTFWLQGMTNLFDIVPFDGLWLDMNEPSNFDDYTDTANGCNYGECPTLASNTKSISDLFEISRELSNISKMAEEDVSYYNNLQWIPTKDDLYVKTLSMDGYC